MFFHILKKDLIRKKTVNIILVLFVIISAMFFGSGLNNILTIANGTDYFFDEAGVGDFLIITMGDNSIGQIEKGLKDEPSVKDVRVEETIFGVYSNVFCNGKWCEGGNTTLFQSFDRLKIRLFDKNNNAITKVEPGHVYIAGYFMRDQKVHEGDTIRIKFGDKEVSLIVSGQAKDAFLGSSFMGNIRFVMSEQDYQTLLSDEYTMLHKRGELGYVDTDSVKDVSSAVSSIPGVAFARGRSVLTLCYVMDFMLAIITLILSICMMIVSFLVLKFSINLTISEEFREIGVMKAIGIPNRSVRGLYVLKYFALACIGGVIGMILSIPFGNMLLKTVSVNMLIKNKMGILVNVIGMVAVILLITLYAYRSTKKVKKASPIDAIRSGQSGERYQKKGALRLGKSRLSTNFYMALNDVLSSPRKYITIVISFFLCTLLVLLIGNTVNTMNSDKMINSFASPADLYISDSDRGMEYMASSIEEIKKSTDELEAKFAAAGIPAKIHIGMMFNYKVTFDGEDQSLYCQWGFNEKITDYKYKKDTVIPQNSSEILITKQVSEQTGAGIGDTMTIDFGTEKINCVVTGYYDTMQNLGNCIRLHQDAPVDTKYISSIGSIEVDFADDLSAKEIEKRKAKVSELFNTKKKNVLNGAEFCRDCYSVVDTMEALELLLITITIVVVILVTILMERSFIADEKNQIAILKAVGFRQRDIVRWHTIRFTFAAFIAVVLAAALCIPATKLCMTPVMEMMGGTGMEYEIKPLQIFVLLPGLVLVATVISTWCVAQYTRTITCRDTASIE